jgi:hypothetical protein
MKKKVKMGWEVPVKDRKKANVFYGGRDEEDSSRKFTLKRRGQGEKYDYIEVTGWLKKQLPIEYFDKEQKDWYEIDIRDDKQIDMFMILTPLKDVRQLEYLVFSLMGYQLNEIADIMKLDRIGDVKKMQLELISELLTKD